MKPTSLNVGLSLSSMALMRPGNCYAAAASVQEDNPSFMLVHGRPVHDALKIRYGHAWLETEVKGVKLVIDVSSAKGVTVVGAEAYYAAGHIKSEQCVCYSLKDARLQMVKTEHYGPWHYDHTDEETVIESVGHWMVKLDEFTDSASGRFTPPKWLQDPKEVIKTFVRFQPKIVLGRREDCLVLANIAVNTKFRRHGIGRAVLHALMTRAKSIQALPYVENVVSEEMRLCIESTFPSSYVATGPNEIPCYVLVD